MAIDSFLKWNGLKLSLDPDVYAPKEDSFLLANAAERLAFGAVLDLGCGSGIVGLCAGKNSKSKEITFADVSENAVSLAEDNVRKNHFKMPVQFVKTDLFSKAGGKFDTICFNPPYLPTRKEEMLEGKINKAFDGGKDGRKVLDRFLRKFAPHLNQKGVLLLLNSSVSAKDRISGNRITKEKLEKSRFTVEQVDSQRFFFEELVVFKAVKSPSS